LTCRSSEINKRRYCYFTEEVNTCNRLSRYKVQRRNFEVWILVVLFLVQIFFFVLVLVFDIQVVERARQIFVVSKNLFEIFAKIHGRVTLIVIRQAKRISLKYLSKNR